MPASASHFCDEVFLEISENFWKIFWVKNAKRERVLQNNIDPKEQSPLELHLFWFFYYVVFSRYCPNARPLSNSQYFEEYSILRL